MLTKKISGYFDVRTYKPNVEKSKQPFKAEGETIVFTATFKLSECPKELSEFVREYSDKNNEKRVAVKFKIGKNCRWFNAQAKQADKPANTELDGKCFNVVIDFTAVHGDPSKMEACGYWANAIQFEQRVENPFTPFDGAIEEPEEKKEEYEEADEKDSNDSLPF